MEQHIPLLELSYAQVSSMPYKLSGLTHLRQVNFDNYIIQNHLPHNFTVLTNLQSIKVTGRTTFNDEDLDIIKNIVSLKSIEVHTNSITHIPESFTKLTDLQNLSFNRLINPKFHNNCLPVSLTILYLTDCLIIELPSAICALVNLTRLNLASNIISKLPEEFTRLTALRDLSLSDNKFTRFPKILYKMDWIEHLDMLTNPFRRFNNRILLLATITKSLKIDIKYPFELIHEFNALTLTAFKKASIGCRWTHSWHYYSCKSTRNAIKTMLILASRDKNKDPKFAETFFYTIPREILIEIFEYLPFYDEQILDCIGA